MSSPKKALKKWKRRWQSKADIGKNVLKNAGPAALVSPLAASYGTYKSQGNDEFDNAVDVLKRTSDPQNNALSVALQPEIPELEEQPVIPIPDESMAANQARRRRTRQSRTGRRSTILSEGLGG